MTKKAKWAVRVISAACVAVAVSGCATKYVAPTSGPTATVNFVAGSDVYGGAVIVYEKDDCENPQFLGFFGHQQGGKLGPLLGRKPVEPRLTATLPSGQKIFTELRAMQGSAIRMSCHITMGFEPDAGKTYEVFFDLTTHECLAKVFHIQADGSKRPELTAARAQKQCWY